MSSIFDCVTERQARPPVRNLPSAAFPATLTTRFPSDIFLFGTGFLPMKRLLVLTLCFLMTLPAFAADGGYKVMYDGGSVPGLKVGNKAELYIDASQVRLVGKDGAPLLIPAAAITEVSYGQDVHRRVGAAIGLAVVSLGVGAIMLLSKSKKHYVGITWVNGDAKGGFAMQCDKNDYRGVLAGLEGVTGKKAVDSEALTVKN
jgi:hypothetical protein